MTALQPHETEIKKLQDGATALWQGWRSTQSSEARAKLVECYLPFARMMAAKLYAKRHSDEFEFDDYLQFATIGLIESIDRYDVDSPAQFTTYATKRISGAVLDGVEGLSERQKQISTHRRRIAERTGMAAGNLRGNQAKSNVFDQLAEIAFGLALGYILDNQGLYLDHELSQPDNQYEAIELRQLQEQLRSLVERLPDRERLLIKYTYFNHMSFETVAQQWGLTRGRIAQLHRNALDRLRKWSQELRQIDVAW